jgi:hypothetical protein
LLDANGVKIVVDININLAYIDIMKTETDIVAARNDAIADAISESQLEYLLEHPEPKNVPHFDSEPVEYYGEPDGETGWGRLHPDYREQREIDTYEKVQLDRLDAIRQGDFDDRPYWVGR